MSSDGHNVNALESLALELLGKPQKEQLVALALIASGATDPNGVILKPRELSLFIYQQKKDKVLPAEVVEIVRRFEILGFVNVDRLDDGRARVVLSTFYEQISSNIDSSNKDKVHVREIVTLESLSLENNALEHCSLVDNAQEHCTTEHCTTKKKKEKREERIENRGVWGGRRKPTPRERTVPSVPAEKQDIDPSEKNTVRDSNEQENEGNTPANRPSENETARSQKDSNLPKQLTFDGAEEIVGERGRVFRKRKQAKDLAEKLVRLWSEVSGRPRLRVLPQRVKMVRARLEEGYQSIDMAKAIYGVCYSPFHRENGYDTFELALRNGKQIEKCCGLWDRHAPVEDIISYQKKTGETVACRAADIAKHHRKLEQEEVFRQRRLVLEQEARERAEKEAAEVFDFNDLDFDFEQQGEGVVAANA